MILYLTHCTCGLFQTQRYFYSIFIGLTDDYSLIASVYTWFVPSLLFACRYFHLFVVSTRDSDCDGEICRSMVFGV